MSQISGMEHEYLRARAESRCAPSVPRGCARNRASRHRVAGRRNFHRMYGQSEYSRRFARCRIDPRRTGLRVGTAPKTYDFLRPGEIILTFDDGPWPGNTPAVLKALRDQCTKAIFFPIGEHALWHPALLRDVAAAGHTVGSHTWSHANLAKLDAAQAKDEIEKGFSAVRAALQEAPSPFFRFPGLRYKPEDMTYLPAATLRRSPPTSIPTTSKHTIRRRSSPRCCRNSRRAAKASS